MGKTYRRQTGDKFERRQRKSQNRGPKKSNVNYNYEEDKYNNSHYEIDKEHEYK